MVKRIFLVILLAVAFTTLQYYLHMLLLDYQNVSIGFDLLGSYIFHFALLVFAVCIIEVVFMLSPVQLGFSYLGVIVVKLGAFIMIFKTVLFGDEPADMSTRVSLVIPMMMYIAVETIYCAFKLKKLDSGF